MQMKTVDGEARFWIGVFTEKLKTIVSHHLYKNYFQMDNRNISSQ